PRKSHLDSKPVPSASAEIYVAGSRDGLDEFSKQIKQWTIFTPGATDLIKVESVRAPASSDKIKPIHSSGRELLFEVVLHAGDKRRQRYILDAFQAYL